VIVLEGKFAESLTEDTVKDSEKLQKEEEIEIPTNENN
jgi:hypothetical protein